MAEEQEEARELAEMRKGGFLSGAAAAGKGGAAGGKLEAAPGARRVRRTIVAVSADGERSTRNVIYSDRDKVRACCLQQGFCSCYSASCASCEGPKYRVLLGWGAPHISCFEQL